MIYLLYFFFFYLKQGEVCHFLQRLMWGVKQEYMNSCRVADGCGSEWSSCSFHHTCRTFWPPSHRDVQQTQPTLSYWDTSEGCTDTGVGTLWQSSLNYFVQLCEKQMFIVTKTSFLLPFFSLCTPKLRAKTWTNVHTRGILIRPRMKSF